MKYKLKKNIMAAFISSLLASVPAYAAEYKGLNSQELDSLIQRTLKTFQVPGMAVGIIKDGKIILSKGYGLRHMDQKDRITDETYFGVASNSKAFTATALAMLIDEGKLSWDDKVIDIIPNMRMKEDYVSREYTIRDLLSHRNGLGLGAGDLMWWPNPGFTAKEVIARMRYLEPVSSFRSKYAYNNMPFVVAGEVIRIKSGMSYAAFIEKRILEPLKMERCAMDTPKMANDKNIAMGHLVLKGKLYTARHYYPLDRVVAAAPAAGLQCSVKGLLKWVDMHLNNGKANGKQLISERRHSDLFTVQIARKVSKNAHKADGTNFTGYGLAFAIKDMYGKKHVGHGGALAGLYSAISMIPELNLGVIVLTNQQSSGAKNAVLHTVLNSYLTDKKTDLVAQYRKNELRGRERDAKAVKKAADARTTPNTSVLPLKEYAGVYKDPWWGKVTIDLRKDGLYFTSKRSVSIRGKVEKFQHNTFILRLDDPVHEADSYMMFELNRKGKVTGLKMKAVRPAADFSYDYRHLNLTKIK
jgi:CubicO group peptidase (beta-lactamase class C family)